MPKSRTPTPTAQHMAEVHALGHPSSPPPLTRWVQPSRARAGEPSVPATVGTASATPCVPNTPDVGSVAQGAGSTSS